MDGKPVSKNLSLLSWTRFSVRPSFFYTLIPISNCHLAREVRQTFALPNTGRTTLTQDPTLPSTSATNQQFVGAPEDELDVATRIGIENMLKMLRDKRLHRFDNSESGAEGSVRVNCILFAY